MIFLFLINKSLIIFINITKISASAIEDYKTKLLNDVNNVMDELKNINEECSDIYLKIHQCPLSVQTLTSYDDMCDNLNKCKEIFKDVDSLKLALGGCINSDEENQLIFENYHNITDSVTKHLEAFCYSDEEGQPCPITKRIRNDDELTNMMVIDNNFDFYNHIKNINLYPKRRIKNMEILMENCYSEKCHQSTLDFIKNSWDEIYYLTLEEYNLKSEQISILSNEECNSKEQLKQPKSDQEQEQKQDQITEKTEQELLKMMEEELKKLEQEQQVYVQEQLKAEIEQLNSEKEHMTMSKEQHEQALNKLNQEIEQLKLEQQKLIETYSQ